MVGAVADFAAVVVATVAVVVAVVAIFAETEKKNQRWGSI